MGICWSDTPHDTIGHLSSTGISQTTSQTTSTGVSRGSNVSGNSRFSASSGDESYPNGQILPTPT
ncbi:hypothetical protein CUMW_275090 [Citrus unshiu]|uniref:Uncharacterized protein n=1 Tax=Citrus unshiu TaxID=55188 RepID=A0A2H5MZM6_CITUN|nr:hypothetical protein CUMW_275090 [Citrus unshiu]